MLEHLGRGDAAANLRVAIDAVLRAGRGPHPTQGGGAGTEQLASVGDELDPRGALGPARRARSDGDLPSQARSAPGSLLEGAGAAQLAGANGRGSCRLWPPMRRFAGPTPSSSTRVHSECPSTVTSTEALGDRAWRATLARSPTVAEEAGWPPRRGSARRRVPRTRTRAEAERAAQRSELQELAGGTATIGGDGQVQIDTVERISRMT